VTHDHEPLAVTSIAAAIAPIIDRLRLGITLRLRNSSVEIATTTGIGEEGGRTFAMLRNTHPSRPVPLDDLRGVFTYMPPDAVQAGIDEIARAGLVESDGTTLVLSQVGRDLMARFVELATATADDMWGPAAATSRLCELTSRVFEAAKETGGPTFAVVSPFDQPLDASPASRLAEMLTALRFHRYDCHVAAWRDAGLTVAEVVALSEGPQRDAIEAATNRCAGVPYGILAEGERFDLVAGLGSLPG
jgi:hypothetical protein